MKTVYGPVPSKRLGRSLGIDPVCRKNKTCSFDCVYCQLGKTQHKSFELKKFVESTELEKELKEALKKAKADVVTFSGSGEPTLAKNLDELVHVVREATNLPVAVLTNSSLFYLKEVRKTLSKFDVVVAKLDAPDQELFLEINNPAKEIKFGETLESIKKMRKEFSGKKFALQCMFIENNKANAREIAALAKEINPDEIQIDTPLRPSPVKPLKKEELNSIKQEFKGLNAVSIYEIEKPMVEVLDLKETLLRRPKI